jgi:membrane peptidoglycan carboxypeptidase
MRKSKIPLKFWLIFIIFISVTGIWSGGYLFQLYIDAGAKKLVSLEKSGMLSHNYGYAWQQINAQKEMRKNAALINNDRKETTSKNADNSELHKINLPSLSAVAEFNHISSFDNTIRITDRNGIPLAELKTVHTSVPLSKINTILITSLLTTEDKNFYNRQKAYDYGALVRSILHAGFLALETFRMHPPRGCSTIQMQVARFLLMKYDSRGYAWTEKSVSRKLTELKLAQALGLVYSKDEILTFYANHCVSAGRGMVGYYDISTGLFGVSPDKLTIPQSLYCARLVKWNRQVPRKIIQQIKVNLPDLADKFHWDKKQQQKIIVQLDSMKFLQAVSSIGKNSFLLDYANEYLHRICQMKGMRRDELAQLDIANPESRIRLYGNATIQLTIDYRLQKLLEKTVSQRGFAQDTCISTDTFMGGHNSKKNHSVAGQYYAYVIMDSKTHKILAYRSTDLLGSRLRSLMTNRYPNGSSVAKPIIYALAYDQEIYKPSDMEADDQEIPDTCRWSRNYFYNQNKVPVGMTYLNLFDTAGYQVRNHNWKFDGYDFMFNHLANSNNILAVETMYRLDTDLKTENQRSRRMRELLDRLGRKDLLSLSNITGPQLYSSIVSVCRDTVYSDEKLAGNYSIALGTLELSLYEQLQMFNILYDNTLMVSPASHPSLFIKSVELADENIKFKDDIKQVSVFSNLQKIAPVYLALHKRLISNPSDNLGIYDICENNGVLSNFAKSGTTDDVIRPFDSGITDEKLTNYGLWNAVLRLRLTKDTMIAMIEHDTLIKSGNHSKIEYDSIPLQEDLDITLACIGECNTRYTGERDGKSLHGYVSKELLKNFGIPCTTGYYRNYEEELVSRTPDKVRYAVSKDPNLSFISRAILKLQTATGEKSSVNEVQFELVQSENKLCLRGKHLRRMQKFALYLGDDAKRYLEYIGKLKKPLSENEAREIVTQIMSLQTENRMVRNDLDNACKSLLKSIDQINDKSTRSN